MKVLNITFLVFFIGLGYLLSGCSSEESNGVDENRKGILLDPLDNSFSFDTLQKVIANKQRITANPNDVWAYYNLGNLYKGINADEKAINKLQKAIEIQPNNAVAHYILVRIYSIQNNPDQAIKYLQEAVKLDQDLIEFSKRDSELDSIRQTLEFQKLINSK